MSVKPENTFIDSINNLLPIAKRAKSAKARASRPDVLLHYEKMNNPYRSGTADSWYSGPGGDVWVEYKFLPRTPQRGLVKPCELLSPLQFEWLTGRYAEGRNVGVIIGCPDGGALLRPGQLPEWGGSFDAKTFSERLLVSRQVLADWILSQTTE